jgi:chromosome segregation ATPase
MSIGRAVMIVSNRKCRALQDATQCRIAMAANGDTPHLVALCRTGDRDGQDNMKERRSETATPEDDDLESTARLPVLDVGSIESGDPRAEFSDKGAPPTLQALDADATALLRMGSSYSQERDRLENQVQTFQSQVGALDRQIGDLTSHIARLSGAVDEREAALDELRAEHAALSAEVDATREQLQATDLARLDVQARETAALARIAGLEPELAAALRRAAALDDLQVAHAGATTELEALRQQLPVLELGRSESAAREAAASARNAQLEAALGVERERAATLAAQSAAASALAAQRAAEIATLNSRLAALDSRAAQSQSENARQSGALQRQLDELRALLAAQREALANTEAQRGVWESLLIDAETARSGELSQAGAAASEQSRRAAALQAELDAARRESAATLARAEAAELKAATLAATLDGVRAELAASQAQAGTTSGELSARVAAQQAELDAVRGESAASRARAEASELNAAALSSALDAAQAELVASQAQAAEAAGRAESVARQAASDAERMTELESALLAQQRALEAAQGVAAAAASEIAALGADNASLKQAVQRLESEASREAEEERVSLLRGMQSELRRSGERVGDLEGDLRAAEDQIHRLESELRSRAPRREETPARGRPPARGDSPATVASAPEPGSALDSAFSDAGAAASADGMTRYFVLTDGDVEIVHPLGRRTTIGRGLDNDIRIDAKFISRHHAVVLAGPHQTVVEDLRSTNGVTVNGKRGSRAVLRDGDIVHVGRTRFRFVQRTRDR